MPTLATKSPPVAPSDDHNPSGVYVLVLLIEAVVIAALYWLGRHFS